MAEPVCFSPPEDFRAWLERPPLVP